MLIVLWVLRNNITKYKTILTNTLLLLLSTLTTAATADLGYHLYTQYTQKPPGERINSEVETIFKYRPNTVIYDSARFGDLAEMGRLTKEFPQTRKIVCQIDELGYRNPIGQKNKKNKVILIGDSFGFGAMTDGENIADVLRNDFKIETYNLSLSGYGPWQEYYTLRQEIDKINKADSCTVVWLLFTGNDLAGRFDSVNVADVKTNWRDNFYTFRKQSPVRQAIKEVVNPKALADTNVFVKDNILFYKPYLKEEQKDLISNNNRMHFLESIDKGIALCKSKGVNLKIAIINSKESFLDERHCLECKLFMDIVTHTSDREWKLVIRPNGLKIDSDPDTGISLKEYLASDTHFNALGNKAFSKFIYYGVFGYPKPLPMLTN